MTRFARTAVATLGLLAGVHLAPADDPPAPVTVGVVGTQLRGVPPESLKVIGGPLRNLFAKRAGVDGGGIELAKDTFDLATMLGDGRCRLGVFHGYEFAWVKEKHPDLVPLVVTAHTTGRPKGCVVVRTDSPATKLADLTAQAVTVPTGNRGHCMLFLVRARVGLPPETAAPQPPAGTAEEALDAVVAGTSPAALVDEAALVGYRHLAPGAAKRLRVLCASEAFPQNVIAYSPKTLSADTAGKLREALVTAHTVPSGRPLVMLWGIARFDPAPQDYADHLVASAKAYPAPPAPVPAP